MKYVVTRDEDVSDEDVICFWSLEDKVLLSLDATGLWIHDEGVPPVYTMPYDALHELYKVEIPPGMFKTIDVVVQYVVEE